MRARVSLPRTRPPTLLFVEDNYDWAFVFCNEFKKQAPDWVVMRTHEGWAVMHQLAKGLVPEALVVDLDMRGVGCRDLIEWVKEQPQFRFLPIVVFSDSDDPAHRQRCARLGVNGYLGKPTSIGELQEQISHIVKLCEEARPLSPEPTEMSCV